MSSYWNDVRRHGLRSAGGLVTPRLHARVPAAGAARFAGRGLLSPAANLVAPISQVDRWIDGSASGRVKPRLILKFLCATHAMYTTKCKLANGGILQPFQAGFILSVSSNCPDRLRTGGPWHSATLHRFDF